MSNYLWLGFSFGERIARAVDCLFADRHDARARNSQRAIRHRPAGRFFSATLAVRFNTPAGETWRDRLAVPDGWNVLSPVDLPFTPASPEEIRLIAVAVPRSAQEGSYTFHYVAGAEADPARELAHAEFTVVVPKISALEIKSELTPDWVIAVEKVSVSWRLYNRGNHSLHIDLKARSTLDYATTLAQLQLDPGGSAVVAGEVAIPPNLRREQNHAFLLDARVHDGKQVTQRTTSISTRIIPRFTTEADFDESLKLSLRTSAISRKKRRARKHRRADGVVRPGLPRLRPRAIIRFFPAPRPHLEFEQRATAARAIHAELSQQNARPAPRRQSLHALAAHPALAFRSRRRGGISSGTSGRG